MIWNRTGSHFFCLTLVEWYNFLHNCKHEKYWISAAKKQYMCGIHWSSNLKQWKRKTKKLIPKIKPMSIAGTYLVITSVQELMHDAMKRIFKVECKPVQRCLIANNLHCLPSCCEFIWGRNIKRSSYFLLDLKKKLQQLKKMLICIFYSGWSKKEEENVDNSGGMTNQKWAGLNDYPGGTTTLSKSRVIEQQLCLRT